MSQANVFIKRTPFAEEEARGLSEMSAIGQIRIVNVLATNSESITLEKINEESPTAAFWRRFGQQLAGYHAITAQEYGFAIDNHIGATPQRNPRVPIKTMPWADYFLTYRLESMVQNPRLRSDSSLQKAFTHQKERIRNLLLQVKEPPCLLHGDLWSGNFICGQGQIPVLIDPAPYHGHREADLAMTELFGGFHPDFYQSYKETFPLAPGYEDRKNIYNLYHVLNHWILFGESYKSQALSILA